MAKPRPINRAGLILHEVIYSLIIPADGQQSSAKAREITGHLFTANLNRGLGTLIEKNIMNVLGVFMSEKADGRLIMSPVVFVKNTRVNFQSSDFIRIWPDTDLDKVKIEMAKMCRGPVTSISASFRYEWLAVNFDQFTDQAGASRTYSKIRLIDPEKEYFVNRRYKTFDECVQIASEVFGLAHEDFARFERGVVP